MLGHQVPVALISANLTVIAFKPFSSAWFFRLVQSHFSLAIRIVVTATGGAALVNDDAVKVVYLIGDSFQGFSIYSLVHMRFNVKRQWVLNLVLNLVSESLKPFYRKNQDSGSLVY
jgi:hypothetical protein